MGGVDLHKFVLDHQHSQQSLKLLPPLLAPPLAPPLALLFVTLRCPH